MLTWWTLPSATHLSGRQISGDNTSWFISLPWQKHNLSLFCQSKYQVVSWILHSLILNRTEELKRPRKGRVWHTIQTAQIIVHAHVKPDDDFVFSRVFAYFDWSRSYLSLFTLIPLFYRCILRKASGKWELRRNSVSGLYRQPINHYIISSLVRYRGRRELVTVDGYCRLSI